MTRPELPDLDGAECEHQDMTPEQFLRKLGNFKPSENWNELTDELDRRYDEQQEVQKEHERRKHDNPRRS